MDGKILTFGKREPESLRHILQRTDIVLSVALRRQFSSRTEAAELLCQVAEQMRYQPLATAVFNQYLAPNGNEQGVCYSHMRVDISRDPFYRPFDHVMTLRVHDPLGLIELDLPWYARFSKKKIDEYFIRLEWMMR